MLLPLLPIQPVVNVTPPISVTAAHLVSVLFHEWGACASATESTYEELLDSIFATLPSIDAMDESTLELQHPVISTESVQTTSEICTCNV